MSARIETTECFPRAFDLLGIGPMPAPEADHAACSGGYTQPGLIGGWMCPCPCHHRRATPEEEQ